MKYVVCLGLKKFTFDNGSTAIGFAELAVNHFTPTEYDSKVNALISIEESEDDGDD